jgi:predicted permease
MSRVRAWFARLGGLFRKERRDRELDAELASHLEMHIEDNLRAGMAAEEARRQAAIKLGGIEQTKEAYRDRRGIPWLESLLQDFRFGLRMLRKNPGFTAVAVSTLALGIGATTVVFSVFYNLLISPFPYKNADRWAVFSVQGLTNVGGWKGRNWFSVPEYVAFRNENHVFEDLTGSESVSVLYDDAKSTRVLQGAYVTTNAFDFYGVSPLLGRGFAPEDGNSGSSATFVMSYKLWRTDFGGDRKVLGAPFSLNGKERTLIGVTPPGFNAYGADIWLPVCISTSADCDARGTLYLTGRLKPGVTLRFAAADLDVIAHSLPKDDGGETNPEKFAVVVQTFRDSLLGNFRKTLVTLLAAVLLLLLIASSNVANLLLARAIVREKEMAVRASVGATRGRLIRQLVIETFMLAATALVIGCALSYGGVKVLLAVIPPNTIPRETAIRMNAPVLLVSLGVTILSAILCGLAPAFHAVNGDLRSRLNSGGKETTKAFHGRLRDILVVTEVALSIVLLIGAGLLLRSFFVMTRVDLGFNPKNILYVRPWFPQGQYNSKDKQNAFTRQLLERISALPGVVSVAESTLLPPLTYDWSDTIIPGKPHAERWDTRYEMCSPGYFQTLGLPLLRGRLFSAADVDAAADVIVVNQAFSRQFFRNEDPLGKRVKLQVLDRPFLDAPHNTYFKIIGVVADYKTRGGDEWQIWPQAFIPYSVQGFSWRTFIARTSVDPRSLTKAVDQAIWTIDPGVGIRDSGSIEDSLREYYRGPQFRLVTLGAFAEIGLVLVAIGIFSVTAYTVSLRTRELGIRLALGAQRGDILRMVLGKGLVLITIGAIVGLCASLGFARLLTSQIGSVSPTDPWTFGTVIFVIVTAGLVACYVPARRATHLDPVVALRHE